MREELLKKIARGLRKSHKDRKNYHCETSHKGRSMNEEINHVGKLRHIIW
jgi:hypothetical protein